MSKQLEKIEDEFRGEQRGLFAAPVNTFAMAQEVARLRRQVKRLKARLQAVSDE